MLLFITNQILSVAISFHGYLRDILPYMRIFIICSKRFYGLIPEIESKLKELGHELTMPNCYENPEMEDSLRNLGPEEHAKWKSEMIRHSVKVIEDNDAVLVLNFKKDDFENYIGGATFLEMYDAFRLNKKIYLYNEIPGGTLHDEILGFQPIVLNGDLSKMV